MPPNKLHKHVQRYWYIKRKFERVTILVKHINRMKYKKTYRYFTSNPLSHNGGNSIQQLLHIETETSIQTVSDGEGEYKSQTVGQCCCQSEMTSF